MAEPTTPPTPASSVVADWSDEQHHRSTVIEPYHQFNHQSATKHIIELYFESESGNSLESDRCEWLQRSLDVINQRIRVLNAEHRLPEALGIIDYGTIIQGWKEGGISLQNLCQWKQYMVGWSTLPPTHDYRYFAHWSPLWERSWDILLPWLQLIWTMHKRQASPEVLEGVEWSFLEYVHKVNVPDMRLNMRPETIISFLHSLGQLLWEMSEDAYEELREELRRTCELAGFPLRKWFPCGFEEELEF